MKIGLIPCNVGARRLIIPFQTLGEKPMQAIEKLGDEVFAKIP